MRARLVHWMYLDLLVRVPVQEFQVRALKKVVLRRIRLGIVAFEPGGLGLKLLQGDLGRSFFHKFGVTASLRINPPPFISVT